MLVTIHQPNFVPRLKVLQKIACTDTWVILTTVQYAKQEWQNRCQIIPNFDLENPFWLTLPVFLPRGSRTTIAEVEVPRLRKVLSQHRTKIYSALKGLPYVSFAMDYWDEVTSLVDSERLAEISTLSMSVALRNYAKIPSLINSSDVNYFGAKSKLVASICHNVGACEYLADSGAVKYLQLSDFSKGTIVRWQDWDGQAELEGLEKWRNTAFINTLARHGPNFLIEHLRNARLVNSVNDIGVKI